MSETGSCIIAPSPEAAARLVSLASLNGMGSTVLVLGGDPEPFGNTGADRVIALSGKTSLMEAYARTAAHVIAREQPKVVLVASSARGQDVAARIAGYLDWGMISDASHLVVGETTVSAERSVYGGRVVRIEETKAPCVVTCAPAAFEPAQGVVTESETVVDGDDDRYLLESREPLVRGAVNLGRADKVVCVGLGVKEREDLRVAQRLADSLGAEIACTRSIAEGRKWLPVDRYIGISGAVIAPRLYLSMGVSGQIQHVFGIRGAGLIVAIDTDENAPIFDAADYGVVGDLYEIVPLLSEAIEAGK
ncbi:MAG: electron transfer flavoprotein subunit alpha/FixB family protein [Actinomyces sp.]|jgi:electron transfer flavoprotein alpha subunit|nr:electron transfer flavoprotein subunit alpha/FixB family protein [Actinomyces sp.]MCI1788911.1 electron transfer flavoprotein subunit alpha/FixB family protein [Actinomyces sp.]